LNGLIPVSVTNQLAKELNIHLLNFLLEILVANMENLEKYLTDLSKFLKYISSNFD
jgi:hypothetical protein